MKLKLKHSSPLLSLGALGIVYATGSDSALMIAFTAIALMYAVFSAVYYAERIAHKVGEPLGTLVLALAVTVIEVALIISIMLSGSGNGNAGDLSLARDTVFSAVMIILNGIIGFCLFIGGVRHNEQGFQERGASTAIGVLTALCVLTLVLPNFTSSADGPVFSSSQLAFAGIVSLVLYLSFIFIQTVKHKEYFMFSSVEDEVSIEEESHSLGGWLVLDIFALLVCLVSVVGLAKLLSPTLEAFVSIIGAPQAVVGIIIAALVLMPESISAFRAARANQLQTSMNLALGSALASIGLTIPTVAAIFIYLDQPLTLGLGTKETIMLALTLLVSTQTISTGKTTLMQGVTHIVLFATFLFMSVFP